MDYVRELEEFMWTKPEGATWPEMAEALGVSYYRINEIIRNFRLEHKDDDITLVCSPNLDNAGPGQGKWIYELVGTYDDSKWWIDNRTLDLNSRLQTIQSVSQTIINVTDGRTVEGRKAKVTHRTISYLRETLADLEIAS